MNSPKNTKVDLHLDWCSYTAAKYACENWHYSGKIPKQKLVKVGVWEDGKFIGCVIFGDGANKGMFNPYGLQSTDGCELVRIALTSHQSTVSQIIAISMKFLRKRCPGIRLVLSFADPDQSHVGKIYQAGNWFYLGKSLSCDEYIVNGERIHGRALRSTRKNHRMGNIPHKNVYEWAKAHLDPNIVKVMGSSKHRYAYPLDKAMRRQIADIALPYPKDANDDQ